MIAELKERLDRLSKLDAQELKEVLPLIVNETRHSGIKEAMIEVPDLPARIMRRLVEIDAAKFASEAPEVVNCFADFLWEAAGIVAERTGRLKLLERFNEVNVSLEADDSPFACHFRINEGELSGGSGLWRLKDQDFKYFGSTSVLMRLLTGDLDMQRALFTELNFEGHPSWLLKLGPAMVIVIPSILRGY